MARRKIERDPAETVVSIGARRIMLKDALDQLEREIHTARTALSTAEKTLIFLKAQWNDDTLRKVREQNAQRTASIGR